MNINRNKQTNFFYAIFFLMTAVCLPISCRAQTAPEMNKQSAQTNVNSTAQNCSSLKDKSTDLPEWKDNALHNAIISRDLKSVKKILSKNAEVNEIAAAGDTPLILVLDRWIPEQKLIATNKNRNFTKEDEIFRLTVIKELFKHGADVDKKGFGGTTPLIKAARTNYDAEHQLKILNLLIENKADVNLQDNRGMTALMWAAENGKSEAVKFLLEHGADRDLKNCEDQTALTLARSANQTGIIQLLEESN